MKVKTANTEYACWELNEICNNQQCFDCSNTVVSYASINNSILLCSSCAIKHKAYDESISQVRSLYLDSWTQEHLQYLKTGGNKRLSELLLLYSIKSSSIDNAQLYYSNLMQFHRDTIKSEVMNLSCPVVLKAEDALKPCSLMDKDLLVPIKTSLVQIVQEKVACLYTQSKDFSQTVYNYGSLSIANMVNRMKQMALSIPMAFRPLK